MPHSTHSPAGWFYVSSPSTFPAGGVGNSKVGYIPRFFRQWLFWYPHRVSRRPAKPVAHGWNATCRLPDNHIPVSAAGHPEWIALCLQLRWGDIAGKNVILLPSCLWMQFSMDEKQWETVLFHFIIKQDGIWIIWCVVYTLQFFVIKCITDKAIF